jgi:uncharacterized protein YodC (DUF2158 family)
MALIADLTAAIGNYEPGDVVTLVSGGPDMTVLDVCLDCGEVEVAWFNFDDENGFAFYNETFPSIALELAS